MEAYKNHLGEIQKHPKHWAYVYEHHRRRVSLVSTKPIVLSQLFTIVASLFAGYLLDLNKESISLIAGAFILLPGIVDLEASLTGALTAKINHQTAKLKAPNWLIVSYSILFSLTVSIFASLIIGLVGGLIGYLIFSASIYKLVILSVVTTSIVALINFPLMSVFTLLVQKLRINPDNVVGPVQSSVIDIVAILAVAVVAKWLI
ncbi:hypothetical protein DYH10_02095 [Candidatus Saccharibacteria bacterium CPR2]|nr:hypothetical protein [Candidatus Saccharibacteria bacterium CPR2]